MRGWAYRIDDVDGDFKAETIKLKDLRPALKFLREQKYYTGDQQVSRPVTTLLIHHALLNTYRLGEISHITIKTGGD